MIAEDPIGIVIEMSAVPRFSGARKYAEMGLMPAGLHRNREYRAPMVAVAQSLDDADADLAHDPVTSGGLLIALPPSEARALLARLERKDYRGTLVALHAAGRALRSEELAARLERDTASCTTFVIGGPLGLHETLLHRVGWLWSMSPLTFPHEIVRALVAEQLYRAVTILRGLPYHK